MPEQVIVDRRKEPYECKHDSTISSLKASEATMQKTLDGVSTKLDLILAQITKVAVLEEKHTNQATDINRAHLYINNLEKEVKDLSKEVRDFISQAKGMSRMAWIVWSILSGGLGIMLVKIMFFMGTVT